MSENFTRGDTPAWSMTLVTDGEQPWPLANTRMFYTLKTVVDDDPLDAQAPIQHWIEIDGTGSVVNSHGITLGGLSQLTGQVVMDAADGTLTHVMPESESTELAPITYLMDVQFVWNTNLPEPSVHTFKLAVPVTVDPDVTRRITIPA